jgi:hypothetical protein
MDLAIECRVSSRPKYIGYAASFENFYGSNAFIKQKVISCGYCEFTLAKKIMLAACN